MKIVKIMNSRIPQLAYVPLPDKMAKVVCRNCGWEESPMPASQFDPGEALVAASTEHMRCVSAEGGKS